MNPPSRPPANRISPQAWEPHKQRIVQLYLEPGSKLKEVMKIIEEETGFVANDKQYYRQLNEIWRIKKNTSLQENEYIQRLYKERNGKNTRVKMYGVRVPIETIQRRGNKHFVSTLERKQKQVAMKEPTIEASLLANIDVGTPTSIATTPRSPMSIDSPEQSIAGVISLNGALSPFPVAATEEQAYPIGPMNQDPSSMFSRVVDALITNPVDSLAGQPQLYQESGIIEPGRQLTSEEILERAHRYFDNGQYNDAMEWYQRALTKFERTFDQNYPRILMIVIYIGDTIYAQGKYESALNWCRNVLGRYGDHSPTHRLYKIHAMSLIGVAYSNLGNREEGLRWCKEALLSFENEEALSGYSKLKSQLFYALGYVLTNKGEHEEGMWYLTDSYSERKKRLGQDHQDTLAAAMEIGSNYLNQGKYSEAMQWGREVLEGEEKILGKTHPSTLTTVLLIAEIFAQSGQYDEAKPHYERALAGLTQTLGEDHPDTRFAANGLHKIASLETGF